MDRIRQDLRFAVSAMRHRPLIAAAIILTLGLGIGANAAIFRAFSAAFLRPLPFPGEERVVRLFLADASRDLRLSPRAELFVAVREHARSFEGIAGQRFNDFTAIIGSHEPQRVAGIEVSEGWAKTLGIQPVIGRTFTADEEKQGISSGVVLISHSTWQSRLGGDPNVLGTRLTLNGRPFVVIGVLPTGMRFPYEAEFWVPARFDEQLESTWGLNIVARLRDGVTYQQMNAELQVLSGRLPEITKHGGMTVIGVPIREVLLDDETAVLVAVSIAVVFLLILVTVNIGNLLMAHSIARQREFAIRSALGASFLRHLQQTLTEGQLLAFGGALVGLAIASASSTLLSFLLPEDLRYVQEGLPFDGRVIAFTAIVAALTGVLFGFIPAFRIARRGSSSVLAGGDRTTVGPSSMRLSAAMTAIQLALALVLLTGAQGMIRDFERRVMRDLGYDPAGVLTVSLALPAERYPGAAERDPLFDALIDKVSAIPGVTAAGTVNLFPAADQGSLFSPVEAEGVERREGAPLMAFSRLVHGDLMKAIGLRIHQGRLLTEDELRRSERVAVISRSLSERLWPGQNPIGKRIRATRAENAPWLEVVGVVRDLQEFYSDHARAIWHPVKLSTDQGITAQMTVVIRHQPGPVAPAIRAAIGEIDPALAVFDIFTAEELYARSLAGRRSARTLTAAFALLGLIVASIGVYASMAFSMARRTREIAVRIALGGTSRMVSGHFLRRAAFLTFAGLTIGTAGALVLARSYGTLLSEADPLAPSSLMLSIAVLSVVALTASWLPLRRATRVDPSLILRGE
jgi:putative ABC transport system permease protein